MELVGDLLELVGTILIALAAIAVHDTFIRRHQIDKVVKKSIHKEHVLAFLGIAMVISGFILRHLA